MPIKIIGRDIKSKILLVERLISMQLMVCRPFIGSDKSRYRLTINAKKHG